MGLYTYIKYHYLLWLGTFHDKLLVTEGPSINKFVYNNNMVQQFNIDISYNVTEARIIFRDYATYKQHK